VCGGAGLLTESVLKRDQGVVSSGPDRLEPNQRAPLLACWFPDVSFSGPGVLLF
jgi:hypothetical protein